MEGFVSFSPSHEGCGGEAATVQILVAENGELMFLGRCEKCGHDFHGEYTTLQLVELTHGAPTLDAKWIESLTQGERLLLAQAPVNRKEC